MRHEEDVFMMTRCSSFIPNSFDSFRFTSYDVDEEILYKVTIILA